MKEGPVSTLITHYYVKPVNFESQPFAAKATYNQFSKGPNTYKKPYQPRQEGGAEGQNN